MNKAIHKLTFLLPLAATFLVACSQDDAPVTVEKENPDTPQITVTRSTASGDAEVKTIFQNGTEVGLSVQGSSSGYTNMKYEYRDGALKSKNGDILWDKGVTSLTVDAYYPYRNDGNYTNPIVLQNQNSETNYYQSDALHATGTVNKSSNSMSLDFEHRTAKVILKFAQAMNEVSILDQPLTTGTGAETGNIKAYDANGDGRTWKACIIPQKGITGLTVNSEIYGVTYKATLNRDNFEAGKQYSYNINNTPSYIDLSKGRVITGSDHIIIQSEGGTTSNNIIIYGTPTVTIANLNIHMTTADDDKDKIALYISGGAPTIILKGNNTLKSEGRNAGLQLGYFNTSVTSASVTIQGDGTDNCSLTAIGSQDGAGIGTPSTSNCGDIAIKNCTVIASISNQGYGGPAGIGSGGNSTCGNITIENATVTSTGSTGGSGIGAAIANERTSVCGDITIKNSTIHATGARSNDDNFGAAIGCGTQSKYSKNSICGKISITLKKGQSKNEFLSNLTTGGKAEKVGRGGFGSSTFGTVGTITWRDFNGNPIN